MTIKTLTEIKQYMHAKLGRVKNNQHGWDHLQRVWQNSQKIVSFLKVEKEIDCSLLEALCFVHDLVYCQYQTGLFSYLFEKQLVKKQIFNLFSLITINHQEKKQIFQAVVNHPHSFPFKRLNKKSDLYSKILQDADTLDLFNDLRKKELFKGKFGFNINKLSLPFLNLIYQYGKKHPEKYFNYPELIFLIGNNAQKNK